MSDLASFLAARYAEVEERLRDLTDPQSVPWSVHYAETGSGPCLNVEVNGLKRYQRWWLDAGAIEWGWTLGEASRELFSVADAERQRDDLTAKRATLAEHAPSHHHRHGSNPLAWWCSVDDEDYPCLTVRWLAWPYRGHPDWRPEWAPEGADT